MDERYRDLLQAINDAAVVQDIDPIDLILAMADGLELNCPEVYEAVSGLILDQSGTQG